MRCEMLCGARILPHPTGWGGGCMRHQYYLYASRLVQGHHIRLMMPAAHYPGYRTPCNSPHPYSSHAVSDMSLCCNTSTTGCSCTNLLCCCHVALCLMKVCQGKKQQQAVGQRVHRTLQAGCGLAHTTTAVSLPAGVVIPHLHTHRAGAVVNHETQQRQRKQS